MALRGVCNNPPLQQPFEKQLKFRHSLPTLRRDSLGQLPSSLDMPSFSEEKKLLIRGSNQLSRSLLEETITVSSKSGNEVEEQVSTKTVVPREQLMKIRLIIAKILDPAHRCEKLIEVGKEYIFLEDVTYEDQKNAETIFAEAIVALEKEIKDPDIRARLWLRIFKKCKEAEIQLAEVDPHKLNKKKAFLDEARMLLTREVDDANATAKAWLTIFERYKESTVFSETLKQEQDVLMELVPYLKDFYIYCKVLLEISHIYEDQDNPDSILRTLKEAIEVAEWIPDYNQKIEMLIEISRRYGDMNFSIDAIAVLEKIFTYAAKLGDSDSEKLKLLRRIALESEDYREVKECLALLRKVKKVVCKILNPRIFRLLESCLSLNLKDKLEVDFIDYEVSERELLVKVRSMIAKIIDPAERCQKLIELSKEYAFLEEEEPAEAILNEAIAILGDQIKDPNAKAMLWLKVFERYKDEEVRWAKKTAVHKMNMKTSFSDETAVILKEEVNDIHETSTSWTTLFKKYEAKEKMYVTSMSTELKRDIGVLIKILPDVTEDYIRSKVLIEISSIYEKQEDMENASDKLKKALETAELVLDVNKKIEVMISISQAYTRRDFLGIALDILEEATKAVRAMKDNPQKLKLLDLLVGEYRRYDHLKQTLK